MTTTRAMPEAAGAASGPLFSRVREDVPGCVPLAFVFDGNPIQPKHEVTTIGWTEPAREKLRALDRILFASHPRRTLPVEGLRGRLEVIDENNIRLDRRLGLRAPQDRTFLWTPRGPAEAGREVTNAVLEWLNNDMPAGLVDESATAIIQELKDLARRQDIVRGGRRSTPVYAWQASARTGTGLPGDRQHGFADLADFVARLLEGHELLPDLGPVRRIAGGQLDQGQADLMTAPVPGGAFSIVVRIQVFTYPGRSAPVVALSFIKRSWAKTLKKTRGRHLSAYALPIDTSRALKFTLKLDWDPKNKEAKYLPEQDYFPIARKYMLGLTMDGEQMAGVGRQIAECPVLVSVGRLVGGRAGSKSGVPDLDKLDAFRNAADVLARAGLRQWDGLTKVDSQAHPVQTADQKWSIRDERPGEYEVWLEAARVSIAACYDGAHRIVIAHHPSCEPDASLAKSKLDDILKGNVHSVLIPIAQSVHGPRAEGDHRKSVDRAEERARRWKPFIDQVRRYEENEGGPVDGILVIAPEWYDNHTRHDDPVSKRAARIALASDLGVPVQYLKPKQEEGERIRGGTDPDKLYEQRLMLAWLDLAWKSRGRVKSAHLAFSDGSGSGASATLEPPDRILAIGIVRRNQTVALRNQRSFVPYAIELDVLKGTCTGRFAKERGQSFVVTPAMPLPKALVELARSGPIQLATDRQNRWKQLQERSQAFFLEVINDLCQGAERPLLLIDAATCRGLWPWVADTELDPANILVSGASHAEADWGALRIVRVRTDNAPKVLLDGCYTGTSEECADVIRYPAPKWAEAQLFRATDARTPVYLSFGSAIRKGRIRGASCYREVTRLKAVQAKPRRFQPVLAKPFTNQWSTPNAVEFAVVRGAPGEHPDDVARLVQELRSVYAHFGDWSTMPAPGYFGGAFKEYLADYDVDEDEVTVDGELEGEESEVGA